MPSSSYGRGTHVISLDAPVTTLVSGAVHAFVVNLAREAHVVDDDDVLGVLLRDRPRCEQHVHLRAWTETLSNRRKLI